jgi:hypothetical protein
MLAPIVDDIRVTPILGRQTIAAIEVVVVVIATLAPIEVASTIVALVLPLAITIGFNAATVLAAGAPRIPLLFGSSLAIAKRLVCSNVLFLLGKRQAAESHGHCRDGAND